MPHVTFIHGIANKPDKETLLENWRLEISDGGLDLEAKGVTSSMVYWADVVYESPLGATTNFESVSAGVGTAEQDTDLAWIDSLPEDQRKLSEKLIKKFGISSIPTGANKDAEPAVPIGEEDDFNLEAIPLPWSIKERVMKRLLKDVHHYLFNASFSPRPGETFDVQTELRKRFIDQLQADKSNFQGPHIVVSHSMGTVISYDCIKNVASCPQIDGYMTVGSPLGISEIHDNFIPSYVKKDAFPTGKLSGNWVNIYDRLDPVAFDARLSNDYLKAGEKVVTDKRVRNFGKWRHSSYKYYGQSALTNHLSGLLGL